MKSLVLLFCVLGLASSKFYLVETNGTGGQQENKTSKHLHEYNDDIDDMDRENADYTDDNELNYDNEKTIDNDSSVDYVDYADDSNYVAPDNEDSNYVGEDDKEEIPTEEFDDNDETLIDDEFDDNDSNYDYDGNDEYGNDYGMEEDYENA